MSLRHVAADSALRWIGDALRTVFANPAPFLLMGLVVAVAAVVPVIGALALAILGPALYGGIVFATREQHAGRGADFQHLFRGFQQPGALPRLLLLCLPGIAAGIVVVVLLVLLLGSALVGAGGGDASALGAGLGAGGLLFVLLALAIGLAAYALVFFAVPQVMLTGAEPIAAMGDSLRACLGNAGAFLLFFFLLLLSTMGLSLLVAWLPTLLGQLLAMTLLVPVVSAALYFAWRDVYGEADVAAPPGPPSIEV